MRSINQAVAESLFLVGCSQATTEVKNGVVIVQGQGFQKRLQFFEAVTDFRWIGFMGFAIGLVELIQNGFAIAASGIKGMVVRIGFQCFGNG